MQEIFIVDLDHTPPPSPQRKFLEFITLNVSILLPFKFFNLLKTAGGGGSGVAKIFEVYDPKRRIFKAFSPV